MDRRDNIERSGLKKYLSPMAVWALSFGCAVGWGAFVMPGTTFLPLAGPAGTAVGIMIGAVIMFIIGVNYSYLMNRYPDAGGTLTYTIKAFGYDHGFLSAWFLMLVYIAIIWANATALSLIIRKLFGALFQFGFHYVVLGYDIYMGEVLLSVVITAVFGCCCMYGKRLAITLQIVLAVILLAGIVICAFTVFDLSDKSFTDLYSGFSASGRPVISQICSIIALTPWAFAGFESVSNSTEDFDFPVKRSIIILGTSVLTGMIAYLLLSGLTSSVVPPQYNSTGEYIAALPGVGGLEGLPVFYSVKSVMGTTGFVILTFTVIAGVITGLVGNFIAASRLMYTMSEDGMLPKWFGALSTDGTPKNAVMFLMCISMVIPFLGRTAIGWIVDVNTIGATIAYAYTSAAAFTLARKEKDGKIIATGIIGLIMSVIFFFYFMSWSVGAMATESYLILAFWSILGFIFFRYVFGRDKERRFGKSTVVWIGLLFLIFFTSLMWIKQANDDMTKEITGNISDYYENRDITEGKVENTELTKAYIDSQIEMASGLQTRNNIIQMCIILASLGIMFSIYNTISKRERQMERAKGVAEERSIAKSTFLSNMSHDIRTPMNAIIGYINLAEQKDVDFNGMREYLGKIKTSSYHLLALINDVLEMSRIETGKMDLELIPIDLRKTFEELRDMFATQMGEKDIAFVVDTSQIKDRFVYCDKNRLNRVLLNLLSNAYKFTPEGGTVSVNIWQIMDDDKDHGRYELRVKDSGIGMTKEFAARVFEAFEQERTSTVSGIQGSGLGMAITKSIVDLMGGTIEVDTAPEQGTEFIVRLTFGIAPEPAGSKAEADKPDKGADFTGLRLLLVEDVAINREIALKILRRLGFVVEIAENGREAVEKVRTSPHGHFDGVLMDIQMPVMDGYEATRTIRGLEDEVLASIPIVAMTANAFSEDVKKAKEAGMNAHIAKPIDINVLVNTLTDIFRSAGDEREV